MQYTGSMIIYKEGTSSYKGDWKYKHQEILKHHRKYIISIHLLGLNNNYCIMEYTLLNKVDKHELIELIYQFNNECLQTFDDFKLVNYFIEIQVK